MENVLQIHDTEYRYRKGCCDDCGFTKGTAANLSGVTAIKAKLCAEIPEPFLCHAGAVVEDDQLTIPDGKEVLCQGWVDECNRLNREGYYQKQPDWLTKHKQALTEIIVEIENDTSSANPAEYFIKRVRETLKENMPVIASGGVSPENA